jgi:hypothetical protein
MDESLDFKIGSGDFIAFESIRYESGVKGDWLQTHISIRAGAFKGAFNANLMLYDFKSFLEQLEPIYRNLEGKAEMSCLEGWINIEVEGDGSGHFTAKCVASDNFSYGNQLVFNLHFDQTELKEYIRQLKAVVAEF